MCGQGVRFRETHKGERRAGVATQVGDRIMVIAVPGMKHGDTGTVVGVDREQWGDDRLLVLISPDKEFPHYACARQGKSQWQNLSR